MQRPAFALLSGVKRPRVSLGEAAGLEARPSGCISQSSSDHKERTQCGAMVFILCLLVSTNPIRRPKPINTQLTKYRSCSQSVLQLISSVPHSSTVFQKLFKRVYIRCSVDGDGFLTSSDLRSVVNFRQAEKHCPHQRSQSVFIRHRK